MRLNVDRWSRPSSTALELIPCGRVRATARYSRAGHLLLDALTHSLQLEQEIQRLTRPAGKALPPRTKPRPRQTPQPAGNSRSPATGHRIAQIALTPRISADYG